MLKTSKHSGLEGYIIKNIKNQINFALQVTSASSDVMVSVRFGRCSNSELNVSVVSPIDVCLCLCPQPGNSNTWFQGAHLLPLLRKVLILPDGPETDLLQNLDRSAHTHTL